MYRTTNEKGEVVGGPMYYISKGMGKKWLAILFAIFGGFASLGIGAYDTYLNGCKYCSANKSPQKTVENYKFHDPASPLLLGYLRETGTIQQGAQKSFFAKGWSVE